MKHKEISSRSLLIIILLTLLIHILFVIFLGISPHALFLNQALAQKLTQLQSTVYPQQARTPDQQQPWVSVQQYQSPQGAPVILADSQIPDNSPHHTQATPEPQKDVLKDTNTDRPEPTLPADTPDTQQPEEKIDETLKQDQTAGDIPVAPVKKKKQETVPYDPNYIPASLFKKKPAQPEHHQAKSASPQTKKRLNLAQLTKEFDAQLPQHAGPTMLGTSNTAKMTEQQLKEGLYTNKILQSIKSTWRAHRTECPPHAPHMVPIHFVITIARNGTVTDVTILKTSGSHLIDQYIIMVMKDTGTSMPPIPAWMKTDNYQLECTGNVNPHVGPENMIIIKR